jgi:redox-sensing transcriptional repressor
MSTLNKANIPNATLKRLVYYMQCLRRMKDNGVDCILSGDIAKKCGVKGSVVRKDLSYFGDFGVRGQGYNVAALHKELEAMFDKMANFKAVIVGAGQLGSAITLHSRKNFKAKIVAAFEQDPEKIGGTIADIPIYHIDSIEDFIKKENIVLAILATPAKGMQELTDRLVSVGIKLILSLALTPISVPDDVQVSYLDILAEVEYLFLKNRDRSGVSF